MPCDNISQDKKVFFLEDGHKYYHVDDIVDGKVCDFEDSKYLFRSPTGIIQDFHEEFDAIDKSEKYVKKHKLPISAEQLRFAWEYLADHASSRGTVLHGYGEALFNGWDCPKPDLARADSVYNLYKELTSKYKLAKTELLVYSREIRLAGQSDLILKNADSSEYYILDYKFLSSPLEMKSYYNRFTRRYKMMYGPFKYLMDTNYSHYSIQLELYRMLMGSLGQKVKSKQLIVITEDSCNIVDTYPMRIWISTDYILHAKYRYGKNKERLYDSSRDYSYLENPYYMH
jgi:hypothetical protein